MCEPATLITIATAMAAAGSAVQGYSAYTGAMYASGVAENNAALSREQAADSIRRGEDEQQRKWREISQIRAAQIAGMAASGVDTSFGSAADLLGDTAVLGTEDVSIIAENAARETRGFHIQAQNFNNESGAQKRQAYAGAVSTAFDIGSTVLGGASQLQGLKLPPTKTSMATSAPYISTGGGFRGGRDRPMYGGGR